MKQVNKVLIINNAEPHVRDFVAPIESILTRQNIQFQTIEVTACLSVDFLLYDACILSASPMGDDIVDKYQKYYQWVNTINIPIFGICAGHQIIGQLFGAQLLRSVEAENGYYDVFINAEHPIFSGYNEKFVVREQHFDSITLPNDFFWLAYSAICKVQVMKHRRRPIYTVQFHAELSNEQMIINFLNL